MKVGKKIIALGIAYFLLGFSGNVFAFWYDEINGKKIFDYDKEIDGLNAANLQNRLQLFRADLEKTQKIRSNAESNLRIIAFGVQSGSDSFNLLDPITGSSDSITIDDLLARNTNRMNEQIIKFAEEKIEKLNALIKKTEDALKRFGTFAVPVAPVQQSVSSSSVSSTSPMLIMPAPFYVKPTPSYQPQILPSVTPFTAPAPVFIQSSEPKEEPAIDVSSLQKQLEKLQQERSGWEVVFKTLSIEEQQSMQPDVDKLNTQIKKLQEQISQAQEKKGVDALAKDERRKQLKQMLVKITDERARLQIRIDALDLEIQKIRQELGTLR